MNSTLNNPEMQTNGFDLAFDFCEGLALVSKDDRYFFINKKGEDVFPSLDIIDALDFSEGYAAVTTKDSYRGYLNKAGEILTGGHKFKVLTSLLEGKAFAVYADSDEWVCIDKEFNELFRLGDFEPVSLFHEGYAVVKKEKNEKDEDYIWWRPNPFKDPSKEKTEEATASPLLEEFDFDDEEEESIFELFGEETPPNWDPYKSLYNNKKAPQKKEKEYVYNFIDKNGNLLLPNWCLEALSFSEGFAAVCIDERLEGTGAGNFHQYNYIDKSGNLLLTNNVYKAESFSEGLAVVALDTDDGGLSFSWCYVDKNGEFVMPYKLPWHPESLPYKLKKRYGNALSFHEGVACVGWKNSDGMDGNMIDKEGHVLYTFTWEENYLLYDYKEGLAGFAELEFFNLRKSVRQYFVDKSGEEIFENMHFDEIRPFSEGMAVVKIGEKFHYIDKSGNFLAV